jgi:hypothetical protein
MLAGVLSHFRSRRITCKAIDDAPDEVRHNQASNHHDMLSYWLTHPKMAHILYSEA